MLNALPDPPRSPRRRAVYAVVLVLLFVLATGLLDGNPGVAPLNLVVAPRALIANALPGLLLSALLLALTRRLLFSMVLTFGAQAVLYWVNAQKMANLASPLVPADFHMIGQLREGGAHLLGGYVHVNVWWLLLAVAALLALVALWRLEPPLLPRRAAPQIGRASCRERV